MWLKTAMPLFALITSCLAKPQDYNDYNNLDDYDYNTVPQCSDFAERSEPELQFR